MREFRFSDESAKERLPTDWISKIDSADASRIASHILVSAFDDLEHAIRLAVRAENLDETVIPATRAKLISDFFIALNQTILDLEWFDSEKPTNLASLLDVREVDPDEVAKEFRRRGTEVAKRLVGIARRDHPDRFEQWVAGMKWRAHLRGAA